MVEMLYYYVLTDMKFKTISNLKLVLFITLPQWNLIPLNKHTMYENHDFFFLIPQCNPYLPHISCYTTCTLLWVFPTFKILCMLCAATEITVTSLTATL